MYLDPYLDDGLPVDGSVVNNHGDRFRGTLRIGLWDPASIHGLFMAYKWVLDPITTYIHWDDPSTVYP